MLLCLFYEGKLLGMPVTFLLSYLANNSILTLVVNVCARVRERSERGANPPPLDTLQSEISAKPCMWWMGAHGKTLPRDLHQFFAVTDVAVSSCFPNIERGAHQRVLESAEVDEFSQPSSSHAHHGAQPHTAMAAAAASLKMGRRVHKSRVD